mmetsp:Transcript_20109/g.39064  ORF Transcript_20109/g.39064 Transcript_20109/m.39064 type:complete len:301 (-) Transcript_20109:516-1418(-)
MFSYLFFVLTAVIAMITYSADLDTLRLAFTVAALSLLGYRLVYYAHRKMLLYVLDLCYWVHACGLFALWFTPVEEANLPKGWMVAVYASAVGPVGGASFMLQQPLLIHHPEAFESFFLHVVPMWVAYAIRWRIGVHHLPPELPIYTIIHDGFSEVYLPWAVFYCLFLIVKPYVPIISKHETLFDWYTGSVSGVATEPAVDRGRPPFLRYAWKPVAYIILHGLFALEGYCAAALCYQYEAVNLAWLAATFLGTVKCSYHFYRASADSSYKPGNKLASGLKDSAGAWILLLPIYYACSRKYI